MDILTYDYIIQGLKDYNNSVEQNYGNVILEYPTKSSFPNTVFAEIRNIANPSFNSAYERVASVGYRVDIYAKTKGSVDKQTIARRIAKIVDTYLSNINLTRVSFNISDMENDNSIFHIIMTYSGNLYENRRILI